MKIKTAFFILLIVILAATSIDAQKEKPFAAVAPVSFLGKISVVKRQIIFNRFQEKLSEYYSLISQKQFQEAQEKAYESLESEECSEEQCIRKIQEYLQVENLFILQILSEEGDTQLSLTLVTLDTKSIKTDYCEQCRTLVLNQRIVALVKKFIPGKDEEATSPPIVQSTPSPEINEKKPIVKQITPNADYQTCAKEYRAEVRKKKGIIAETILRTAKIKEHCGKSVSEVTKETDLPPNPEYQKCAKEYRAEVRRKKGIFAGAILTTTEIKQHCGKSSPKSSKDKPLVMENKKTLEKSNTSDADYQTCAKEYRAEVRRKKGIFAGALLSTAEVKQHCGKF